MEGVMFRVSGKGDSYHAKAWDAKCARQAAGEYALRTYCQALLVLCWSVPKQGGQVMPGSKPVGSGPSSCQCLPGAMFRNRAVCQLLLVVPKETPAGGTSGALRVHETPLEIPT